MNSYVICNVKIVTPQEVIENGSVCIYNGVIESVERTDPKNLHKNCHIINGLGKWLIPGIIDLHNDSIEKEIEPRPNALFPVEIALFSLESRLISHGITSIYHSFSFMEGESAVRTADRVIANVVDINRLKEYGLIRHFIHARYDVTEKTFCPILIDLINQDQVQMISFMDHTPGQGQYKQIEEFQEFQKKYRNLDDEGVNKIIEKRLLKAQSVNPVEFIDMLAEKARRHGLPMASHDDDSPDKVMFMKQRGVTISEFPIDLETAKRAAREGLFVIVGAPNIVRGISNSGNMRAIEAVQNNAAHILCSDYMSSSMLHAVFHLHYKHGLDMVQAVNMATINPAQAVRIDANLGSIEPGKIADLVVVNEINNIPFVDQVFVNGFKVLEKERSFGWRINMSNCAGETKECL